MFAHGSLPPAKKPVEIPLISPFWLSARSIRRNVFVRFTNWARRLSARTTSRKRSQKWSRWRKQKLNGTSSAHCNPTKQRRWRSIFSGFRAWTGSRYCGGCRAQRPASHPDLNICIQVNIDREPQKAGVMPELVKEIARAALALPRLRLRGLMTIPQAASALHDPSGSYAAHGNPVSRSHRRRDGTGYFIHGDVGRPGSSHNAREHHGPNRHRPVRAETGQRRNLILKRYPNQMLITFIGGGNMATALITGLVNPPRAHLEIRVCDPSDQARKHLEKHLRHANIHRCRRCHYRRRGCDCPG